MTQPNPKADSQSPAEGLRQQIETLALEIGQQVTNSYEMKHGLWEGLSVQNVNSINKAEKALTAYAATVEREAETTGALNVLELLAKDGTISEKVKLKMLDTVFEWERLAALQGPQDAE